MDNENRFEGNEDDHRMPTVAPEHDCSFAMSEAGHLYARVDMLVEALADAAQGMLDAIEQGVPQAEGIPEADATFITNGFAAAMVHIMETAKNVESVFKTEQELANLTDISGFLS